MRRTPPPPAKLVRLASVLRLVNNGPISKAYFVIREIWCTDISTTGTVFDRIGVYNTHIYIYVRTSNYIQMGGGGELRVYRGPYFVPVGEYRGLSKIISELPIPGL